MVPAMNADQQVQQHQWCPSIAYQYDVERRYVPDGKTATVDHILYTSCNIFRMVPLPNAVPVSATRVCNSAQPSLPCAYSPVAPVAYQVILEPGVGQFRELESPRVHTRINSWGLFCVQIDLRKAREREFATLDEQSTNNGIAELYAR